jgi:hypothetical protein
MVQTLYVLQYQQPGQEKPNFFLVTSDGGSIGPSPTSDLDFLLRAAYDRRPDADIRLDVDSRPLSSARNRVYGGEYVRGLDSRFHGEVNQARKSKPKLPKVL